MWFILHCIMDSQEIPYVLLAVQALDLMLILLKWPVLKLHTENVVEMAYLLMHRQMPNHLRHQQQLIDHNL